MKDFKNFVNSGGNGRRQSGENQSSPAGGMDISSMLSMLAGKYEGASEDEIVSAIISEAKKGRANGTLSDADILSFEATISPMLDEKQRKKLKKVVQYLLKN